jgi:hypothetical protein
VTRRASQTSGTRSQGPRSGPSHAPNAANTPLDCLVGCLASDQASFPAPFSPVPRLFSLVPQASTPIRLCPAFPTCPQSHPLKLYTLCCIHELPTRPHSLYLQSHYVRRHGGSGWTTFTLTSIKLYLFFPRPHHIWALSCFTMAGNFVPTEQGCSYFHALPLLLSAPNWAHLRRIPNSKLPSSHSPPMLRPHPRQSHPEGKELSGVAGWIVLIDTGPGPDALPCAMC